MNLDRIGKYTPEILSFVRFIVALLFLEHGSAKLLGFPTPPSGSPAFMSLMWVQGLFELIGGALLAIGLFTRPVVFILSGNMADAYFMAHAPKSFFPLLNGGDGAILYCFLFLLFFVARARHSAVANLGAPASGSGRVAHEHHGQAQPASG